MTSLGLLMLEQCRGLPSLKCQLLLEEQTHRSHVFLAVPESLLTCKEPHVSPEELPKPEQPARGGCWRQSALLRWQNQERSVPSSASHISHGSAPTSRGLADLMLLFIYSPSLQELCHQRPAHLALKDNRNMAGRVELSEQMDNELHDEAGGGRGSQ